jgi:hypothetical protein
MKSSVQIILFSAIFFLLFSFIYHLTALNQKIIINQQQPTPLSSWFPNFPYNNFPNDVFFNAYAPPLRDNRYQNIGYVNAQYRQIGILTPLNGAKDNILPLFGKPLYVNRDKWNFYTLSSNNIKLPIRYQGRSCSCETNGCNNLYTGDSVFVEGYSEVFVATIYENDQIQYIPFL